MLFGSQHLANVDEDLCALAYDVASTRDVVVLQGARTVAEEQTDIDAGVSHLKRPEDSYHVVIPGKRDKALAVDLGPLVNGAVPWKSHPAFFDLGAFVKQRAAALGITPFSWGGDWPRPFDFDHFQKAPPPA